MNTEDKEKQSKAVEIENRPKQEKASQEKVKAKTQAEQRAAERQVALLTAGLLAAKDRQGVWMNPDRKLYPSFYPKGPAISPFNAICLTLHSDQNSFRSNLYTTFHEAKNRNEGVKASERGVPFNWYNWSQYVNRNKPEDIISRKDYQALGTEEKEQYKGIHNREIRVLFNIDQTMTPAVDPDSYEKAIGWNGGNDERRPSPTEEKILRGAVDTFLESVSTNLVSVEHSAGEHQARYDIIQDVIRLPEPQSYTHYHDYVNDAISEIIRSTGHQERLARESTVNQRSESGIAYETLVVELATGAKMLELGLPAKLSPASQAYVNDWARDLREDPKLIDSVETDVNNALEVVRKAERGEKVNYSSLVNQQKAQQLQDKRKPQVSSAEGLVLADIITHHGMDVRDENFRNHEDKVEFLQKFNLGYYLDQIQYARKMTDSEDPDVAEAAYTEIYNNAAMIDQLAREYRPADWNIKGRRGVEELMHEILDENPKDMVIVLDEQQRKADIILPQGAFSGGKAIMADGTERSFYVQPSEVLNDKERKDAKIQYNDAPGFSKTRIDHALANDPAFSVAGTRYFNRDGVAGFHADDRYFEGKRLFAARLSNWKLEDVRGFDIGEHVEQSRHPLFEKVLMMKDDSNRWLLFMQAQGEKPFGVYPDKADVNKFFTASHQGNATITSAVRQELAGKYYELAKVNPSLQVNLMGEKASEEDLARLQRVNIFKNKNGQFMIMAKVTDTPKDMPPREISAAQWQRLWLSPDHEEYKRDLAAKIFADILHPEMSKQQVPVKEEVAESKKPDRKAQPEKSNLSPIVKQFDDLKKKHPDALLLFRTGEFYQTYKDDAEKASRILGITLTKSSRITDAEGKSLSMAAFPYHQLDTYLPKLIRAGERVAICDQIEPVREKQVPDRNEAKEEEHASRGFHR